MKCEEASEEPSTVSTEKILKLECNITKETNYMHTGILDVCFSSINTSIMLTFHYYSRSIKELRKLLPPLEGRQSIPDDRGCLAFL